MKIVSENSPADIARAQASDRFGWALVELTANLLRITRGAGKSYEVPSQVTKLLEAICSYEEAYGHFPPETELQSVLSVREERDTQYGPNQMRQDAVDEIVRASLQVAASRLLDQRTQITRAEHEIFEGVNSIQAWRAEVNRETPSTRRRQPTQISRRIRSAKKPG